MGKPNQPLNLPHNSAGNRGIERRMRWHLLVYATVVAALLVVWLPTVATPAPTRLSTGNPSVMAAFVNVPNAAAQATSPGGVSTNLAWWFQGNAGVQTSGTAVTGWDDMVGALNTTQATAGNRPSYTRYQNFNPVVTFDGSTDFLRNTAGYWKATTNNQQYNIFAVSTAQNTGNHSLFGENTNNGVQTIWAPGSGTVYNGLYSTYLSSAAWGGVVGTPNLWTGRYNNSSSPKVNAIQRDGRQIANNATTIAFNGANASFYLGIHDGSNYHFQGDIAELIMYNRDLSAAERSQVESYLAIKWGITLMGTQAITYTDSTGAVVWNATANSVYHNDVAGIGRDDNAGLNQKQSRSINSDDLVTIGLGAIATTNISNTNTFTNDRSFLLWGNDNGDIRYLAPYTNTTGLNARLDRVWKVVNTSNISNVEFCVPATTQATHLLVNTSDPTFASATTAISLTTQTVAGQVSLCTSGLTFDDGAYFTLARFVQAPVGIVSNVAWWFRGDVGVQTSGAAVTGWNDSTIGWANGTDLPAVTQATVNNQPSYTRYQNFNPVVTFDGSTDFLRNTAGFWKNSTSNQQYNVFAVSNAQSNGNHTLFGENTSLAVQTFWAPLSGNVYNGFYNSSYLISVAWGGTAGTPNLWTGRYNNSSSPKVNAIGRDGRQIANNTTTAAFNGANSPLYVGIHDGSNYHFQGDIAELLMYDRDLTTVERQRIESYLALKWGVSLSQNTATNYVASDDTVIWDATTNVSYTHDIAGIGVDALSELNQKQSRSVNSDDLVTIGLGAIAGANISNTNTFAADRSFLIWGNNNGDIRYLRSYTNTTGINARLTRVWKVDNTKAVSNVEFCVPATTQASHLLINTSDPTFVSATTAISLTTKTAAGQASLCTSGVTFADGAYFTLARFVQAPAGIVPNVAWWFRGDVGVQTSGTAVTGWNDSAIGWANGTDLPSVTQATVNNQPSYTRYQNFNPVVTFDGSNDYLRNTAGFWRGRNNNQQYNVFAVSTAQNTGNNTLFAENTSSGAQFMWTPAGTDIYQGLWNSYLSNVTWGGVVGTPNLWTGRFNNSSSPKVNAIGRDGRQLVSGTATIAFNGNNSALYLGNWYDASSYPFYGDIAEIVMYDRDLTTVERQRIESYLALKWGVSLSQNTATNYVASDGTVIWDATANVSYTHDIAGIGVDALSELNQKQSRSVNNDDLVTIGLGAIAGANISNTNTFAADRSFLLWGNNNGVIRYLQPYTGTATINARLDRVWKVDNTKAVSNVEFCVPATTQATHLLVNANNPTFNSGTVETALTAKTAAEQASLCASGLTFADGVYFTLARFVQAPAGIVPNVAWWFRGDVGVQTSGTAVTGWNDSAIGWANGTDLPSVTQGAAANRPTYTRYQNFNPVVTFDGSNDYLRNNAGFWRGRNNNQQYNVFAVSTAQNTGNNTLFAEDTSSGAQFMWTPGGTDIYQGLWSSYYSNVTWGGVVGTPNLWTGRFNNSSSPKVNAIGRDGRQIANNTTTAAFNGANAALYIGNWYDASSYPFYGDIAEVVMYDRDLTTVERQRVESYLALKWGVSLSQNTATNYVASDDTVIWDATTNVSYTHDIAGIGVDALSELNQKQSRSVNSDDLVTIGLGAIAGANISNTNTFAADRSFLLWGNNNGAIRYQQPYSGSGVVNTRLDRVWKVDNTKAVSNVEFCVPATTQATRLLVNASDPTFISATTEVSLTTKTVAGQVSLCASNQTFNDGVYFTLARYNQAPGNVVTNLAWWFRGDVGVQTSGTAVTVWNDSVIGWVNGTDLPSVTQATAGNQPSYTRYQNFNPVVTFDGSNDSLRNTAGFWKNSTNNQQFNTFVVSVNRNPGGVNWAFSENTNQGWQMMLLPWVANAYSGFWGGSYYSQVAWGGTVDIPNLWTGRFNNSSSPKVNAIQRDGRQLVSTTATAAFNGSNSPLDVGTGAGYFYNGDLAEVIMYDRDLTISERNQVESYLALKWGITLTGTRAISYTNSVGTVVWNAATNSAYQYDVAGIGRDDSSGLYQKQSASINSDNLVTMGLGVIATTNISNTRTFANDRAFLVWGNNNAVTTFDTPIVGTELRTMTRLWRVSETGAGGNPVGSVKVRIPSATFAGANPKIVRSTDITFTTSDTILPLVDDGNGNLEAVIDFANGDYFTLAQEPPPAPGAVNNNLAWWFRGDWGVQTTGTAVTQWNDGTGVFNVSQGAVNNRPTYTKYQNFNRIVTFDGSNDYLRNTGGYWKNRTNNQQYNTFVVSINRNAGGVNAAFGEGTNVEPQIMFLPYSGNAYNGFWSSYLSNSNQIGTVGTPYLWGGRFNNSSSPKLNAIRRDGVQLASSASTVAFNGNNSPLDIGASVPNGWYYNGDIAEVALYARDLTTIERQRVESYLALKWGINLGGAKAISYTNSAGTVIWNATTDSAYSYRVAGIGFDKYTALDQRISRSNSPGGVVTIATTDDFTSPNLDNSRTAVSANSYLLWGDNNQDATTWVTNTVASGYPTGKARLTREWLVRATGSLPPVSIGVQVNDTTLDLPDVYGVLYLIVDRDGDGSFSDEAAQRMTARGNGLYTIANVTLGNGMRFTFGTAAGGIRGEVFQDNDTDGLRDPNEPGLDGVTITAIDAAGTTTTTVTDIEGKYIFLNSGLEGNTRVTFDLPSDSSITSLVSTADLSALENLTTTILGSNSRTSVQFVYVGDGWTVATAGFTPKDRPSPCANPTVATVCYENGAGSKQAGWLSFPFNSGPNQYKTAASTNQMGAVWGSAYDSKTGQLFTAALLKRHVGLGPLANYNGTDTYTVDGVYVVQYSGSTGTFNPSTPGFKLQGVSGIDLGTVERHPDTNEKLDNDYEIMSKSVSKDVDAFNKAGTVGFGNAETFAGNVWLINANQRALIKVTEAGLPLNGSPAPAANVMQYSITNPGCSNGDFRPWALSFYNGLGYVGVVCSAETSQVRGDLHAYILSFNPSNVESGFSTVLDFPLNFKREPASWGGVAGWQPWARNLADIKVQLQGRVSYPQPILADIDFTANGDMIIGFMDRWGLQTTVYDPNPVTGVQYVAETAGDLMRACNTGSNTWAIEGDLGCGGYTKLSGLNKLTDDGPFGAGEFFGSDTHMVCHGGDLHFEDLTGSTCVVGNTVLATRYGTFSEGGMLYTPSMLKLSATYGYYQDVFITPATLPCNAQNLNNALGELTCMCPALPVEIGNRVWNDYNHNGRQDPGEPAIAGLLVELVNAGGSVIGTAITDARGEYYFSSASGTSTSSIKYGLSIPGAGVAVRIPNASGGSQQVPLAGLTLTVADQGTDDRLDSDATMNGTNAVIFVDTAGGRIDHTYDFGFAPDIWDLALRKSVSLQYAAPGDDVTFAIEVFNQIGGPMDNIVLIDYVPANLTVNDSDWTPSTLTGPGTITRTLNAGDELPVGGLLPGKSVVVNLTTQILNGVANNTVVTNTVEVASVTDINGQPFTDRDSTPDTTQANDPLVDDMIDNTGGDEDDHDVAVIIVTAQTDIYDLALRKTAEATIVSEGDDVPFTIELFNQGTTAANSLQLVDRYPTGFTLSPNETGWTDQGNGTATRVLASRLEPGASTKVTILLRAGSTMGNLLNYAEILQDDNDDVDSQPEEDELDGNGDALIDNIISDNGTADEDDHDVAPVTVRRFDLALRKRLATGEANPTAKGADVTFVIDIFNQGSVNAYDISIVDYLSPTLMLSENDANGWIAGDPNQVLNSIPGPLAPGTSARLTITLRVSDTAPFGILNNYAEIARASDTPAGEATPDADSTADNGNGNDLLVDDVIDNSNNDEDDHDIASVTIGHFDLALTKIYKADEGNRASGGNNTDGIIGVGERVTFTLAITNQGDVDAYDIRVTDNSPRGLIIDDSNPVYNILRGWQVESDQIGHYLFPGPLKPGESASIDVIIYVVGPAHPFYPPSGLTGVQTVWGEISAASYKTGGPTVIDEDSIPDPDYTNDPGGQPGSPADDYLDGNGTGTPGDGVAATDEDDEDPAQVTVIPSFDLAIIKYPLVDTFGGNAVPLVQPGELITYEYRIVNQSLQTAQDITLTEHIPAGLILDDPNWTPSTLVGPGLAERVHNGINLAANGVYTDIVRFRVNPAIAVSTIYTNVIEISGVNGPGNTTVIDMDSVPNRDGATQKVVKNDFLTDNYLADPESFDEDDNDIAVLGAEIEDWGDNPDAGVGNGALDYSTVITDNGARHLVIDGLHIGALVDGETDGFPTDGAFGDDSDNTDDEDGVNLDDLNLIIGANATIRVRATNIISSPAYLYGFVDFNANGVFTDTGEVISVTVPMNSVNAEFTLNFGTVPNNSVTNSYARFRLSTADDLTAVGAAPDGEIEDYPFFMTANVVDLALRKVRAGAATIQPGRDVAFTITVINQGAVTATNITVVDYLPAGFTLSTNDNNGWNSGPNGTVTKDLTATLTPSGTVNATTNTSIVLTASTATNGTYTNTAEIATVTDENNIPAADIDSIADATNGNGSGESTAMEDDQVTENGKLAGQDEDDHDLATVNVNVLAANLQLSKQATPTVSKSGDTVIYTLTVFNEGPGDATNVVVQDALPLGVTYVSHDPAAAATYNTTTRTISWTVASLPANSSTTLSITVVVD